MNEEDDCATLSGDQVTILESLFERENSYFLQVIATDVNSSCSKEDFPSFIAHICWRNKGMSEKVITSLCGMIDKEDFVFSKLVKLAPVLIAVARLDDDLSEFRGGSLV
jgi:hypothetical protein